MEKIRIGDACELLNGFAFKSENYVKEGIRIIRIANVQKGYIEDNTPAFYPADSEGLDKYMLEENDLLMSLTGDIRYIRKVVFLALLFVPTLQIWGQKEAWEEIVQKNLTLGKDIKCLRDSVSSKQKREAKLKAEVKKANLLIEEKEAKLAESIQSNSTENLAKLEAEISKLRDTNIQLNKKYCENEKIYAELSQKLNDIKNKMEGMDTYQSIQNEINYKQNIQYLTQRYSLIDSKKLEELQNTLDNYKSFNGFEDYKKRVNAAVKNKEMYERGVNALNSEFNNTNIVNIRKKII